MKDEDIRDLFAKFLTQYDPAYADGIWRRHNETFRVFWINRIITGDPKELTEAQIDEIIKILDRNGKGNTKQSEAVARAMIPQGAWRRMFYELCSNKELAGVISEILLETDLAKKADLIDKLYQMNEGKKNHLTGKSGNAINAMLAAHDPIHNLSIISLKDRKSLLEYLEITLGFDLEMGSIGRRIVESNRALMERFQLMGLAGNARTLSRFCYDASFKPLWKGEHTVKRADKNVDVIVPTDIEIDEPDVVETEDPRESIQIQALLADIGSRMNLKIWLPKADRSRVFKYWNPPEGSILDELPLNYDDITLKTIEQIDMLWLKGRSIIRAFEVEHTTSVYSGILRMADLLALQPNMSIKLHIVAPSTKREKVFREIRRPVFSLLERGPLAEMCTYLSYESIKDLADSKHLGYLLDGVLDEYEESAD